MLPPHYKNLRNETMAASVLFVPKSHDETSNPRLSLLVGDASKPGRLRPRHRSRKRCRLPQGPRYLQPHLHNNSNLATGRRSANGLHKDPGLQPLRPLSKPATSPETIAAALFLTLPPFLRFHLSRDVRHRDPIASAGPVDSS